MYTCTHRRCGVETITLQEYFQFQVVSIRRKERGYSTTELNTKQETILHGT